MGLTPCVRHGITGMAGFGMFLLVLGSISAFALVFGFTKASTAAEGSVETITSAFNLSPLSMIAYILTYDWVPLSGRVIEGSSGIIATKIQGKYKKATIPLYIENHIKTFFTHLRTMSESVQSAAKEDAFSEAAKTIPGVENAEKGMLDVLGPIGMLEDVFYADWQSSADTCSSVANDVSNGRYDKFIKAVMEEAQEGGGWFDDFYYDDFTDDFTDDNVPHDWISEVHNYGHLIEDLCNRLKKNVPGPASEKITETSTTAKVPNPFSGVRHAFEAGIAVAVVLALLSGITTAYLVHYALLPSKHSHSSRSDLEEPLAMST